jgi:hypothetical protein
VYSVKIENNLYECKTEITNQNISYAIELYLGKNNIEKPPYPCTKGFKY